MKWEENPTSSFKYDGKRVNRRKVISKTIFGQFEVYEAVGGNTFIRHPFLESNYVGPTGFNNGLEDWFGASKKKVENMEKGIKECELVMSKVKTIVAAY